MADKPDLIIIGAGPGGYVAALRASQLKKRVLLVEEDRVGGTCMNYGCIPTKYLLHQTQKLKEVRATQTLTGPKDQISLDWSAVQKNRVSVVDRLVRGTEFLLKKNGVDLVQGRAELLSAREVKVTTKDADRVHTAEAILIATGSRAADLPFLKPDGRTVITSREALELLDVPRSLLVVGAGAIGLEIGTIYSRLGCAVTILEMMPSLLPGCDREMGTRLERILKLQGLVLYTHMRIETAERKEGAVVLKGTCTRTNTPFTFEAEKVLLAAGRTPNVDTFQPASPVVPATQAGFIEVNERLETRVPGIYAIGDVIGGRLLAHKASHEGLAAAENMAGGKETIEADAMPMAVFTHPEYASVGLTEEEAKERGIPVRVGVFSLQANGRALTMDSLEGLVKVIAGPGDRMIGGHIIAPGASDWIAELSLAIKKRLTLQDVCSSVHIHPTLGEGIAEAALKAKGRALHILN